MRLAVATPVRPLRSAPPHELADIVRDEAFVVVEVDELDQVVRDALGLEALHLADHDLATGPTYDSAYRSGTLEAVVPVADAAGCHPLYVAATPKALVARHRAGDVDMAEYCERVRWEAHRPGAVATYLLLETCLRSFRSAIREVRTTLEDIEDAMIESVDRHHVITLHDLHRRVSGMRRALSEYGDAIADMNDVLGTDDETPSEVLDLAHAHAGAIAAVQSRLAVVRDEAANAMELYRSLATTRQGLVINRLTVVSGVLLPLTVITGFFGMNFAWMTDRIDTAATFWLLGMVLPAAIALGAILFMWRRGWLLVLQAELADDDPPRA